MAKPVLNARTRQSKGKGAAKKLRRNKQIPAIFYGSSTEPVMLAVDYLQLEQIIKKSAGENIVLDIKVQSDDGTETRSAILKELQTDPTKDTYLHADFYEISMDKELTVHVPINLINTPVGVENGGILQHVSRELSVSCLPDKLIDVLELDVSKLEIGDSLHVRDIELPEGITSLDEDHLTIAVVAAPTVMPEEVAEEEIEKEAAEGEAVEKEKTEAESKRGKESSGKDKGGEGRS